MDWSVHWNILSALLAEVFVPEQKEKQTASVMLQSYLLHSNKGTLVQVELSHQGEIQKLSFSNLITSKLQELQLILSNDLIYCSSLRLSQSNFPSLTYSIEIHPSSTLQVGKFLRKQEQVNLSSGQEQFISSDESEQSFLVLHLSIKIKMLNFDAQSNSFINKSIG